MDSRIILAVIGVIATAFGRSEAITCYFCTNYESDLKCTYPFVSAGVDTCQGDFCINSSGTMFGRWIVIRDCRNTVDESDVCYYARDEGEKNSSICYCSTDYCNGGLPVNVGQPVNDGQPENDGQLVKPTFYSVFNGVVIATVTAIGWMN